ncbi:hypothetical protein [Numidum massiliense]|uniref:hypothetical protein n=1 Tax=Numidum massiliense TaxID=1522315 RepID=UPI0006D56953|nr:hypothetical protein [Numidum massiliense]
MGAQRACERIYDFKVLILAHNMEGLITAEQHLYEQAIDVFEKQSVYRVSTIPILGSEVCFILI